MSVARELLAFDRAPPPTRLASELLAFDRESLRTYDVDGRMHVKVCNISKATVSPYYGREIPNSEALGLHPGTVYKLYRAADELLIAAPTFNNLQLLLLHTVVNAEKPEMPTTAGCIGSDVRFEVPYLKASIAVWTARAIALIESKKQCQLSASYRYRADMTPGTSPEGLAYDGVMRDIIGNHVALVEEGRAGPDVLVSDALPLEFSRVSHKSMKRPKLFALLAPYLKADVDTVALDAKLDAEAEAAGDADLEDEDEEKKAAKLKAARDKRAKDKAARDAMTDEERAAADAANTTAAVDAALKTRGYVTAADAGKLASDAAAAAVKARDDLHTARETVKPLVGVVALDSATAVYQHALKHIGVAYDGVHESALPAIVAAEIRARKGGPSQRVASDSVSTEHTLDAVFHA